MVDLSTSIGHIKLKNPVLVASGTFGHAKEFAPYLDLKKLGDIVTKTITVKPRLGNPPPRIVETPSGMLNAIGLQNPGADKFISDKLPFMKTLKIPIIASVMGYSVEEFLQVVGIFEKDGGIDGYELNLSCPNVAYGSKEKSEGPRMFAHDAGLVSQVVSAVRGATQRTVIAKLGPDVSDIGKIAQAAESAGADAVALINTFMAMVIDIKTRKPVLGNRTGGLSGPCVRPIAVRMVWETAQKVKIPVIGIGGIQTSRDALEMLIAGASAVEVGTAAFVNPAVCEEILKGIENFMKQEKLTHLKGLIGSVKS